MKYAVKFKISAIYTQNMSLKIIIVWLHQKWNSYYNLMNFLRLNAMVRNPVMAAVVILKNKKEATKYLMF